MNDPEVDKKLCYEHEVLWARYKIREHQLDYVVQEIYREIGQILSLVRVELSFLSLEKVITTEKSTELGNLVGKAIHDLRDMCKYFSPEPNSIDDGDFVKAILHELTRTRIPVTPKQIKVKGEASSLSAGVELIVYGMLQEIFSLIQNQLYEGFRFKIDYTRDAVIFQIVYKGTPISLNQVDLKREEKLHLTRLNLLDRAKLLNGYLQMVKRADNLVRIKLVVPFKTP